MVEDEIQEFDMQELYVLIFFHLLHQDHTFQEMNNLLDDLLLYTKANMIKADTKLSKAFELTHQITFDNDTKVGLAWHIIKVNGVSYIFHNGGTAGSSSFLAYNTEKNLAVIILSNSGASVDAVGVGILKALQ